MSTEKPVPPQHTPSPGPAWAAPSGGAPAGSAGGPPRPGKWLAITLLVLGVAAAGVGGYVLQYATEFSTFREDWVLTALAIGGVGIVLLALGLQRLLRGSAGWIAAVAVFVVLGGVTTAVVLRAQAANDEHRAGVAAQTAVLARLQLVCEAGPGLPAEAVPEAAAYDRLPGLHPAAFFSTYTDGTIHGWMGLLPPEPWRAAAVEQAQLVVCTTLTDDALERCDYSKNAGARVLSRIRHVEEVVLYEARTRTELARTRFEGSEPPPCPDTVSFDEHESLKDWEGSYPDAQRVVDFARPWIEVGPGGPASASP